MATTYPVTLLHSSNETSQVPQHRPFIFPNPHHITTASHWQQHPLSSSGNASSTTIDPAIESFHRSLPSYAETTLHHLPSLAASLGLGDLYLKDEGTRFGLPAFKILGASWAVHRAVCRELGLDPFVAKTVAEVREAAVEAAAARQAGGGEGIRLVTCTEGNWGRAVARMARDLRVSATIYAPGFMSAATRKLIRAEDPKLVEVVVLDDGSYDDCIAATREDAERTGALMVMDTSWEGYKEVPQWVTDGYTTMLTETDRQVAAYLKDSSGGADAVPRPNTFFVSIGVGSWAHAVVQHYKSLSPTGNQIIAVEPTAAPCLTESLHRGALTSIATGHTIMAGMCCGTPSELAWPVLRDGVAASVVVTDGEAHRAVVELREQGVEAGPCGAATWAALKKWTDTLGEKERREKVVVLFSTEGRREYEVPEEA